MKRSIKSLVFSLLMIIGLVPLCSYAQHNEASAAESAPAMSVVGVAAANEDFSTLVTAVQAAELVETLDGDGPFTVFAPTNAAFGKLPEGTVESLIQPENKEQLTTILTYHVIPGEYDAASVLEAIASSGGSFSVATVQGSMLTLSVSDGNVVLTDAQGNTSKVIMADVAASNGIIHVIDTVVLP